MDFLKKEYKNEYCLVGLKRSGQHAIINWLCRQLNGKTLFINNFTSWVSNQKNYKSSCVYENGELKIKNDLFESVKSNIFDNLVYNFEDTKIEEAFTINNNAKKILILRDAFNLACSRSKAKFAINPNWIPIWMNHAECFLNKQKDILFVNFNKWNKNRSYRTKICEILEIKFTDNGFKDASIQGSSFESSNIKFNMLNKRFLQNKNQIKSISDNRELNHYCQKIFKFKIF